jgi:hypothetical protein
MTDAGKVEHDNSPTLSNQPNALDISICVIFASYNGQRRSRFYTQTYLRHSMDVSDSLSKPTGRIKFYKQMDILMGQRCPSYVTTMHTTTHKTPQTTKYNIPIDHNNLSNPELMDPTSPYHIIGSTCCLSDLSSLSIYPINYEDLDCFDYNYVHSFNPTSVGGVIGMTS